MTEHTGTTPAGAIVVPELTRLFDASGPFVTAYLTSEPAVENAPIVERQRWKSLRRELTERGATPSAIDAIDSHVGFAHTLGECLAVVANGRDVLHVEHWPDPPARDHARWALLPAIIPLIELRQASPPHVVALVDRRGADLIAAGPDGDRVEEVEGAGFPITKVHAGGWSERRYQQRAENTWERNAAEVAAELERLARDTRAAVVVIAGDVRARAALRRDLPSWLDGLVHEISGGRAPGTDEDTEASDIARLVATATAEQTVDLLRKYREELGQHHRAVAGPKDTLAALARAQVDVLLVHDDPADERTAWFGPEPTQTSLDRGELVDLGVGIEHTREGRLVDVAVRAAFGTGAAIRVIPQAGPVAGALGAILRWS